MFGLSLDKKLVLYRQIILATGFLAVVGWGTAYAVRSVGQRQFQAEAAQLKAGQDQLRDERDMARTQLAAAQQEVGALTKRMGEQVAAVGPASTASVKPDAKNKRR